jgi:branched-chain amino acid aminotransferase
MKVFVNNKIVPSEKARISVFDHGLLYGDGIFETLRSYNGVVFKLDAHLKRLRKSASLIRLSLPFTQKELGSIIYDTLKANKLSDAYIRISVTRGEGPIGLDTALCPEPNVIVMTKQLMPYPDQLYTGGVKVIVAKTKRNLKEALDPKIKSLNFLNNVLAKTEAVKRKAFEAIMLNHRDHVTEGTVSNIFMVKRGILMTPSVDSGILDGITRQTVIRIAQRMRIEPIQKNIRLKELYDAEEVFLTNTSLEVMPVRQLDNVLYKKRDITNIIRDEYNKVVQREIKRQDR